MVKNTNELRYCHFYVNFLPRTPEIKLRILFLVLIILKVSVRLQLKSSTYAGNNGT